MSEYHKELITTQINFYRSLMSNNLKDSKLIKTVNDMDIRFTQLPRLLLNVKELKYHYIVNKTLFTCTNFKATRDKQTCIYGYLFSSCTGEHLYVCSSPTFNSADGEYRHRVIPYKQAEDTYSKNIEVFKYLEDKIISDMELGKIEFSCDIFYSKDMTISNSKYKDSVNSSRLAIKLFIFCWICDFHTIHNKVAENHINPAYQYVIYDKEYVKIYDKLMKDIGFDAYSIIVDNISDYYENILTEKTIARARLQCGQKLMPLTYRETSNIGDINFAAWRELYIGNICTNLVINGICPNFPFIGDWFFIQNSKVDLYDNNSMHEKYEHSEIAKNISEQLISANKYNYKNIKNKLFINGKFRTLSNKISKSIIYNDSHIRRTDISICIFSEYVGRTIRDLPILSLFEDIPEYTSIFKNDDIFAKHMFEFIYGFYCMNSKINILHGDVHLNNATIYRLYKLINESKDNPTNEKFIPNIGLKNPTTLYILNQNEIYNFKHYGTISMIIDFSRSIIGDFDRIKKDFGDRFAELYFKEQRDRVLRILNHYFNTFTTKYKQNLEALMIENFPLIFKITTAIDTYTIMHFLDSMFTKINEKTKNTNINISEKSHRLINKLEKMAEKLLINNLQDAINRKIVNPDDIEWPNYVILKECFSTFRVKNYSDIDNVDVIDIYNYMNDVKYKMDEYSSYPGILQLENEKNIGKKYGIVSEELLKFRKYQELLTNQENAVDLIAEKYDTDKNTAFSNESSWMFE